MMELQTFLELRSIRMQQCLKLIIVVRGDLPRPDKTRTAAFKMCWPTDRELNSSVIVLSGLHYSIEYCNTIAKRATVFA